MARAVMRLNEEELKFFHSNYVYMWKKLNTAPYYVSGYGEPPSWVHGVEFLPSYVNLSKCMNPDYVPSINLVNKIVHFYNENIAPSVDTFSFLHELLEAGDNGRTALTCSSFEPFCGTYYCYYYSDIVHEKYIRGAVLHLFEANGDLHANLVYDIVSDIDLLNTQILNFLKCDSASADQFIDFRNTLPLPRRLMSYYTGLGKVSPGLINLQLRRADIDGECITLYLPSNSIQSEGFIGGLGIAFFVTAEKEFQFYHFGFERTDNNCLCPLSLDDTKLTELLSLTKGNNERVVMSPSDNTAWLNHLIFTKDQ